MRRQTLCIPLIPLVLFLCLSGCQGSVQENNLALGPDSIPARGEVTDG